MTCTWDQWDDLGGRILLPRLPIILSQFYSLFINSVSYQMYFQGIDFLGELARVNLVTYTPKPQLIKKLAPEMEL